MKSNDKLLINLYTIFFKYTKTKTKRQAKHKKFGGIKVVVFLVLTLQMVL